MYRCPRATGKLKSDCLHEAECNKTPYGRVLRVPDKTNPDYSGKFPIIQSTGKNSTDIEHHVNELISVF